VLATDADATKEKRRLAPLLLARLSGERRAAATTAAGEGEETAAAAAATADERRRAIRGDAPVAVVSLLPIAGRAITGVRMATSGDIIGTTGERRQRSAGTKGGGELWIKKSGTSLIAL
jgi:hypothetical protein